MVNGTLFSSKVITYWNCEFRYTPHNILLIFVIRSCVYYFVEQSAWVSFFLCVSNAYSECHHSELSLGREAAPIHAKRGYNIFSITFESGDLESRGWLSTPSVIAPVTIVDISLKKDRVFSKMVTVIFLEKGQAWRVIVAALLKTPQGVSIVAYHTVLWNNAWNISNPSNFRYGCIIKL